MNFVSVKNYHYKDFDWETYVNYYSHLYNQNFVTKDQLWWHYINFGESQNYMFFSIHKCNLHFQLYVFFFQLLSITL